MDEARVIAWLDSLSDKQFAEFFYRAVADRVTSDSPKWKGHFVLAHAEKSDALWETAIIASHDAAEYDSEWADGVPFCQSGQCTQCQSNLQCYAKHAICPICGTSVYCT